MSLYYYHVLDKQGNIRIGYIDAESNESAQKIFEQGEVQEIIAIEKADISPY